MRYAEQLIDHGDFVADKHGAWRDSQPGAEQGNEFIRRAGWNRYAKWHLAIDEDHPGNVKARFKFPFGDFVNVRRSALIAIQMRAHQYGYAEIENAAASLQKRLEARVRQR